MNIKNGTFTGEDKVIVGAMISIAVLVIAGLVAISLASTNAGEIATTVGAAVVAIVSLAARHPPASTAIVPETSEILPTATTKVP